MAVLSAIERAWLSQERPGNHAANLVFTIKYPASCSANLIKSRQRNHFFMRGDLENGISRCVDNRLAGSNMFRAEILDDLRARGRNVSQYSGYPCFRDEALDHRRRKATGIGGKRLGENNSCHLPVTGCGVL